MSQHVIDVLNFTWTCVHDFVYFGVYTVLMRFNLVKHRNSVEERLAALEAKFAPKG